MEADNYAATVENEFTINELDDDSLGMIFNKLPFIDRIRVESVCQRWDAVSEASWSTYTKRLKIGTDILSTDDDITEEKHILQKILQRSGRYLEEIVFERDDIMWVIFPMGTIRWIAERCPRLKRLNTGNLMLNEEDWLACSNLEALSSSDAGDQIGNYLGLDVLFRLNKRLRRLEISSYYQLTASDFDNLDPGQLKFLQIENCRKFELTAKLADKLAESLVELRYSLCLRFPLNLQNLGKLTNLRSLDLKAYRRWLDIELPIADIARNCPKLESLFLVVSVWDACDPDVFALFDLPCLRRFVIIVHENIMPFEEYARLNQRASHIPFFLIDICDKCTAIMEPFEYCEHHCRDWRW